MAGPFAVAVGRIPALANHLAPGLQALRKSDRNAIRINDARKLAGSIDIDNALRGVYPDASRWDYCIGVNRSAKSDSVVWVEVHPANSLSVADLVKKARWLLSWLRGPGKPLRALDRGPPDLRWVPSGPVAIRRGGREHALLAKAGVRFPERRVDLSP
jgi:hypothetical protein